MQNYHLGCNFYYSQVQELPFVSGKSCTYIKRYININKIHIKPVLNGGRKSIVPASVSERFGWEVESLMIGLLMRIMSWLILMIINNRNLMSDTEVGYLYLKGELCCNSIDYSLEFELRIDVQG